MSGSLPGEGWELRFTASEPRASEYAEEYRALGFEVRLERVNAAGADMPDASCGSCLSGVDVFEIWVRRPA